jgi:hypothetical protein
MSDKAANPYGKWGQKNWKVVVCIGVAIGAVDSVFRMLLRPDLGFGTLDSVENMSVWIVVVFWLNAMTFGDHPARRNRGT